jgi:hypothetical protein
VTADEPSSAVRLLRHDGELGRRQIGPRHVRSLGEHRDPVEDVDMEVPLRRLRQASGSTRSPRMTTLATGSGGSPPASTLLGHRSILAWWPTRSEDIPFARSLYAVRRSPNTSAIAATPECLPRCRETGRKRVRAARLSRARPARPVECPTRPLPEAAEFPFTATTSHWGLPQVAGGRLRRWRVTRRRRPQTSRRAGEGQLPLLHSLRGVLGGRLDVLRLQVRERQRGCGRLFCRRRADRITVAPGMRSPRMHGPPCIFPRVDGIRP